MGYGVLDALLKKKLIDGPETVTDGYVSESIDIDNREDEFAIQIDWDSGVAPNLTVTVELSSDGNTFVPSEAYQLLSDVDGTHLFDISGTGASFLRLVFSGTGSIDVIQAIYSAKRRH